MFCQRSVVSHRMTDKVVQLHHRIDRDSWAIHLRPFMLSFIGHNSHGLPAMLDDSKGVQLDLHMDQASPWPCRLQRYVWC